MQKCNHSSYKECAWANTKYHINHPDEEQYGSCYKCKGLMNKGAYLGEYENGDLVWNIHHINSNPRDNNCKNLTAAHPECNRQLG